MTDRAALFCRTLELRGKLDKAKMLNPEQLQVAFRLDEETTRAVWKRLHPAPRWFIRACHRLDAVIAAVSPEGTPREDWKHPSEPHHLRWLLWEATKGGDMVSSASGLGFVQGVLVCAGLISMSSESQLIEKYKQEDRNDGLPI